MDVIDIYSAKNRLQEHCQQRYLSLPVYSILEKTGSDHSPLFQAEVIVDGTVFVGDWASRKREAEKCAAMKALIIILKLPPSPMKPIINDKSKDPCLWLEKLDLTTKEQTTEPMECD